MARQSPILPHITDPLPETLGYGPAGNAVEVVERFDEIEFEYAALRRACALFDQPQRGTIELRGPDALGFLDRMLTQKLSDLQPGQARCALWLNRQGRIRADLRVVALEDRVLIDLDVHAVGATIATLSEYLFSEEVEMTDVTESTHRLAIHGPDAPRLLARFSGPSASLNAGGKVTSFEIAGISVVADRWDRAGEPGFEITVPTEHASTVWRAILANAEEHESEPPIRVRPAGWHAFNIARIESGTPLFMLDFGTDSLPAETGVLHDRVSFAKGCYLGQEIVARMKSLGHPKQCLAAIRLEKGTAIPSDWQPVTGTPVFARDNQDNAIGTVTSSTISPMLGGEIIMFAMLKWASAQPEALVRFAGPGGGIDAVVQPQLQFWPRPA